MADAVVSFAIENVGNILIQEAKFLHGVRDQVEEMKTELQRMECFLRDADRRQGESETVLNLVSQIREATYEAEDVIERCVLKAALRRRGGVVNRIKRYSLFINRAVELHKVGSKIESIKNKLTSLREGLQLYGIKEHTRSLPQTSRRQRQSYAHVTDHNVVGLDHKISEVVGQLVATEEEDDKALVAARGPVVCISGMGGLGKTTLAKKVYHDYTKVRKHFQGFAWVYISQQFKERDVWESILSQLTDQKKTNIEKLTDDELTSLLYQLQKEKKCLVVIDDIWSNEAWVKLSAAFPYLEEDNKSKILLTTRNKDVALHGVYHTGLNTLNDTHSLELLINTIRFLGGPHHPVKDKLSMEECAREMVKQCSGLPLAIVVLGGILATKHELKEWEKVGRTIKSSLSRGNKKEDDGVTSVLESSYYDLPHILKSCFLYLSQYPEDREIRTTHLMQRWMGEGFVSSLECGMGETMEDVAEQYLNELISRCLVQAGRRSHTGRVKTCWMHDLMRDLCILKATEEGLVHVIDHRVGNDETNLEKARSIDKIHRLCILANEERLPNKKYPKSLLSYYRGISPQLRSMLWFCEIDSNSKAWKAGLIAKNLKLGRVLVLESLYGFGMCGFNKQIGNLIHLRYLRLGDCKLGSLPRSIDKLKCLQTLDLTGCWILEVKLPDSIWRMEQLRHLYLPSNGFCESRKQRVGNLRNLHTLDYFPPEKFDLQQNLAKLTTKVRKLAIHECIKEVREIITSQEIVFNCMHSLSLGKEQYLPNDVTVDVEAITKACPHLSKLSVYNSPIQKSNFLWPSNLTKLALKDSLLGENHIRSLGMLQSLKILFLYDKSFPGKELIFDENAFPQLQHLLLKQLGDLEDWTVHERALPNLSRLEIESCKKMKYVPDRFQFLNELKEVQITRMPYQFIRRLQPGGDDWHKVHHIPSISFIDCE